MQFARDTFYVALRDALAAINPARTITLDGQVRPAVVSLENEPVTVADPTATVDPLTQATTRRPAVANAFYLEWGAVRAAAGFDASPRPLLAMDCAIAFCTAGSVEYAGVDRGREFARLAAELLGMCAAGSADKQDYTQTPPADLGSRILWTRPRFAAPQAIGAELQGSAAVTVLFFPEVNG